jgi:hypothetical protein
MAWVSFMKVGLLLLARKVTDLSIRGGSVKEIINGCGDCLMSDTKWKHLHQDSVERMNSLDWLWEEKGSDKFWVPATDSVNQIWLEIDASLAR